MKKNEAARGKQRVKVGASCKKGRHSHCTVQDCGCDCGHLPGMNIEPSKP